MKKILTLTLKELLLTSRDRPALVLVIIAPLALMTVLGLAFGRGDKLSPVPVIVVNQDHSEVGRKLVEQLQRDSSELLVITESDDLAAAYKSVDDDKVAAAVVLPDLTSHAASTSGDPARIDIYCNPARAIGAGVVKTIFARTAERISNTRLGTSVTIGQLLATGRLEPRDVQAFAPGLGARVAASFGQERVTLRERSGAAAPADAQTNMLGYFAPSMAIMFLMILMMSPSRSILSERDNGTLDRLRATPTSASELMAGKMSGMMVTGLAQMAVLVAISSIVLGVRWGNPAGVALLIVLLVTSIGSMGLALSTLSKTLSNANTVGTTVLMILSVVSGNFIPRSSFPTWMQKIGYIGPNAWGIEGFAKLSHGGAARDLVPETIALLTMTAVFFILSVMGFRRILR